MTNTRRQFLGSAAALAAGTALSPGAAALPQTDAVEAAPESLSILILGGTGFIGPHQVEHALARGHRVTTFNRGSSAGMYGDRVEELVGDRDSLKGAGLSALEGDRRWDVVIDNSGYVPRHVRDSAELLKDRVGHYLYISTVAVYDYAEAPLEAGVRVARRDAPLHAALEPDVERVTGATYGPLKAEGDRIVRDLYGERGAAVRPCYIVGPGDTSDRFTYWVDRAARGGNLVCPAFPERQVNWIDVRDLCPFVVKLVEDRTAGAFNAVGPVSPTTNEELLHGLRATCAGPIQLHWASPEQLREAGFGTPMFDASRLNQRTDATAAIAAGLTHRSLADTVRDTRVWWGEQSDERRARPQRWPSAAAEAKVLASMEGGD